MESHSMYDPNDRIAASPNYIILVVELFTFCGRKFDICHNFQTNMVKNGKPQKKI